MIDYMIAYCFLLESKLLLMKLRRGIGNKYWREASCDHLSCSAQIKAFDYIYYHRLMRFLESEGFIVDEYESRKEEMNHSIESQLNQFISSDEDEEKGSQSEEMVQVDSAEVIREMHPDDMMQPDWQGLLAMCLQADKRKMWAEHYEKCVLVKNVDMDAGTPKQKV